jgi:hypothetical protein
VVYKIYFADPVNFPTLYVAPDGSVLNPDLTVAVHARHGIRVEPADVPPLVKKGIKERAPAGEVSYITVENWGARKVYVVTFKDETHSPRLLFGDDGSVLDETQ